MGTPERWSWRQEGHPELAGQKHGEGTLNKADGGTYTGGWSQDGRPTTERLDRLLELNETSGGSGGEDMKACCTWFAFV